jgi:two-component system, NarL family, response regulator
MAIRILIADDHEVVRTGLIALLEAQDDMTVVGEASDGEQAVRSYTALEPDVALVDLQMPIRGGISALTEIRERFPAAVVVVLTTYSGDVQATRALRAGARGYLLKTALRTELVSAIRAVIDGRIYVSPEVEEEIAAHADEEPLTPRELAILQHLASGTSNKGIARNLDITEQTVKWHLKSIFAKLRASDRTDAVLKAGRRGVFDF